MKFLQIDYSLRLIKPVLDGTVSSFEVSTRATDIYNVKIQTKLARSVWVSCASWYRQGGDGKVFGIFPGPAVLFWWWMRSTNWNHYSAVPSQRWNEYRRRQKSRTVLLFGLVAVSASALVINSVGLKFSLSQ